MIEESCIAEQAECSRLVSCRAATHSSVRLMNSDAQYTETVWPVGNYIPNQYQLRNIS